MSKEQGHVVVIGSGVIGTACAYYLAGAGWQVTMLDRGQLGKGCSHGNCGFVCPSHVLPMAEPGTVGKTIKALFSKNSPFSIKPRLSPALWSWLLRFAFRCNHATMMEDARACQSLLNSSRALYDQLLKTEPIACEWQTQGLLYVYQTQKEMDGFAATNKLLSEHFNLTAKRYDGAELEALEPALKPGLAGAYHHLTDAHLRPDKLLSSWRGILASKGVTVRENCEVKGFRRNKGRAEALVTSEGEMQAEAFVVATGATTPFLSKELGCRIPIQPGKGYSITMTRPARCPVFPLIFPERKVAVTPMQSGYRLGSTMEFAGYDSTINRARLQLLRDGAAPFLHEPFGEQVEEEWFGWRPMTYDSKPIIDRSPALANVLIAAGHNMLGVSMAPGTGKLVGELLSGQTPHLDPTPFRVDRF